jgi:hypothetical protein
MFEVFAMLTGKARDASRIEIGKGTSGPVAATCFATSQASKSWLAKDHL